MLSVPTMEVCGRGLPGIPIAPWPCAPCSPGTGEADEDDFHQPDGPAAGGGRGRGRCRLAVFVAPTGGEQAFAPIPGLSVTHTCVRASQVQTSVCQEEKNAYRMGRLWETEMTSLLGFFLNILQITKRFWGRTQNLPILS